MNGRTVRTAVRWVVGFVVVSHGALHLLGAAKGLKWAEVRTLAEPISTGLGAAWLAALVTIATGVLLVGRVRWWWTVGAVAVAVVLSQVVIVTSWADAKAGTIANFVLLAAVVYGWASQGPQGERAEYPRRATGALDIPHVAGVVTEADLQPLPAPVAAYVRQSGALGQPRMQTLRARFHGRIRKSGLEIDCAEPVATSNDLCILAPTALVGAPVIWKVVQPARPAARAVGTRLGTS